MFPYFILGLALLAAVALFAQWFLTADPKSIARTLRSAARWALPGFVAVFVLYMLATGGLRTLLFTALILLPFFWNLRALRQRRARAARGPSPGQASEVNTRYLSMTLDHDSGEMSGVVLDGSFRGARLEDLELDKLIELWRECREKDPESAAVLEAYLDRMQGASWRERAGHDESETPASAGPMSEQEALQILGLEQGAGKEEIVAAHHKLLRKVHPDTGGSNYLAAKINAAKDLLLKLREGTG